MGYDLVVKDTDGKGDNYFRANIWGMGELRDLMASAGLLQEAAWPKFPASADFPSPQAYEVAQAEVLRARATEEGKIFDYKFCSNDGWLVTSEECTLIYEALKGWKSDDSDQTKWVRSFAQFCRRASAKGGFEVF